MRNRFVFKGGIRLKKYIYKVKSWERRRSRWLARRLDLDLDLDLGLAEAKAKAKEERGGRPRGIIIKEERLGVSMLFRARIR